MSILTRPVLEINWNNLLDNYNTLHKIAPQALAAAVVKDEAYSLGAENVVKKLYQEAGCRNFLSLMPLREKKSARRLRRQIFCSAGNR